MGFIYDDHGKLFIRVQYPEHFSKEPEHTLVNPQLQSNTGGPTDVVQSMP